MLRIVCWGNKVITHDTSIFARSSRPRADAGAEIFSCFVAACNVARTPDGLRDLLASTSAQLGFSRMALLTHDTDEVLQSLSVSIHNWAEADLSAFVAPSPARHPVFRTVEGAEAVLSWRSTAFQARLSSFERRLLDDWAARGIEHAYTQRIPGSLWPASFTLVAPRNRDVAADDLAWAMRSGMVAFHWAISLQRPLLKKGERLTPREHQAMALASLVGLRPKEVARFTGVSVNTTRTFRQNAMARLLVNSPEEAAWRMLETGQMFARTQLAFPRKRK